MHQRVVGDTHQERGRLHKSGLTSAQSVYSKDIKFNVDATSEDEFLPIEVNGVFKDLPVINGIFEQSSLRNLIRLGQVEALRDLDQRSHVV